MPGKQTLTVSKYMHGNRTSPSGGTDMPTVGAAIGSESVPDYDQFAGMTREQTVHAGSQAERLGGACRPVRDPG